MLFRNIYINDKMKNEKNCEEVSKHKTQDHDYL